MYKLLLILLLSTSANAEELKDETEQPKDEMVCTATKLPTGCHVCCETDGIRACRLMAKRACPKVKGEEE